MKTKILLLTFLALVLAASSMLTVAKGQSSSIPDAVQTLDLPNGDAYLSPDGLHILLASRIQSSGAESLCVFSAAGKQETCGEFPTTPDLWNIRWSPDGKWISLTENFFLNMREPDIWVMDAQTGRVTDLTDDGLTKLNISQLWASPSLDVVPVWMPDSSQIVFLRYHGVPSATDPSQYDEQADLYAVTPIGGDVVRLAALAYPPGTPRLSTYALALSPDGKQIAYNLDVRKPTEPSNGLWIADLDGKNARQILSVYGLTDIAFSADGHFLLGLNGQKLAAFTNTWDQSSSMAVAREGGNLLALDSSRPSQWAGWSPSGTALVYIVRHMQQPDQDGLYVVDAPGKAGKLIAAGEFLPPGNTSSTSSQRSLLRWAANNTILVRSPGKLALLSLGSGD